MARDGEQRAFTAIYERHHDGLYRYCLAILHDRDDASDALQGAMMKALLAIPAKKPEVPLRPWLYRIAHNEAVSVRRRRSSHANIDQVSLPFGRGVDDLAFERAELKMIVDDLLALPERQRSALVMRELNGFEYTDIAASLDTSPAAAKQTVYEARVALYDRAEGRRMSCARVRMAISAGDRRVLRGRRISAHMRSCVECQEFEHAIAERGDVLAALAPPAGGLGLVGLFKALLGGGAGGSSGGGSGGGGLLAGLSGGGTTVGSAAALKSAAALAVVVIASTGPSVVRGVSSGAGGSGSHSAAAAPPAQAALLGEPQLAPSTPLLLATNPHIRLAAPAHPGAKSGALALGTAGSPRVLNVAPAPAAPTSQPAPPPSAPPIHAVAPSPAPVATSPGVVADPAPVPVPTVVAAPPSTPVPSPIPQAPDPTPPPTDPTTPPLITPPVALPPVSDPGLPPVPDVTGPGGTVDDTGQAVNGLVGDVLGSTGVGG